MTIFDPIPLRNHLKHYLVINITGFKNSAAHLKHKERKDPERAHFVAAFMALMEDGSVIQKSNYFEAGKCEFADSFHYERPS